MKASHVSMISSLFSLCCQRLQVVAFVCLKAFFNAPVHPFVLLLCLRFCSSCLAVVNSCLLGFPFLNLTQCLCGNLPLVVGVPGTQHFIACPTPITLCHFTSMVSSSISSCRTWNLLESVMLNSSLLLVSLRKKVLYIKRWFVLSVQFLLSLSFNSATRRWWFEAISATRLTRTS